MMRSIWSIELRGPRWLGSKVDLSLGQVGAWDWSYQRGQAEVGAWRHPHRRNC